MGTVTNVKVRPMNVEWAGSALGFTEGDIEFSAEDQVVDITAHQEGTNVLSGIRTGKSATLSLQLKETNKEMVQYLFGQSGYTGNASGGSVNVVGWGRNKDFSHVLSQAGKLVLHPADLASSNKAEDICAWKAYPVVESFNFSGENASTINVSFKIFPDTSKADVFRLFVIGDHSTGDFSATGA